LAGEAGEVVSGVELMRALEKSERDQAGTDASELA